MTDKFDYFIKRLAKLPDCKNDEFHRLADYVELKCLMNKDGEYSKKEFISDAIERADDLGEGDFEENKLLRKLPKSEKSDKWESIADDVYRLIESRVILFGESYPFSLSENEKSIQLIKNISIGKNYIFLLLCSNLKYTLKFKQDLTSSFESYSLKVLSNYFPTADLKLFGSSNSEDIENEWKSAKLWDKLIWMETFLKANLLINEDEISEYDKGDRGIDIVGKIPTGDELNYFSIIFGQCACSPSEWVKKQMEIHENTFHELIKFPVTPMYYMFIPFSFRNSRNTWHDRTQLFRTVLIDRHRILLWFNSLELLESLSANNVLDEILNFKEPIF